MVKLKKRSGSMERVQINVRLSEQLISKIDQKRIEIQRTEGKNIPTRSDVVRLAIEAYLSSKSSKHK